MWTSLRTVHLGIGLLNSCLLDSCLSASRLSDSPPPSGRGSSGRGSLGRGSLGRGSSVVVVGARFVLHTRPPYLAQAREGGERLERLGSTKREEENLYCIKLTLDARGAHPLTRACSKYQGGLNT